MKVINIYGAPFSGKSTLAAGIFHNMKVNSKNCELVSEYAKDLVFENRNDILINAQYYIFAKQLRRLQRLLNHNVEFCVTDAPILHGICYMPNSKCKQQFIDIHLHEYQKFDNLNFLLRLDVDRKFEQSGRVHNYEQAKLKETEIVNMLNFNNITFLEIPKFGDNVAFVIDVIKGHWK